MFFTAALITSVVTTMSLVASASPTVNVVSHAEMLNWLATTDAQLIYIGEPIDKDIARRNALNTMVVYCNTRVGAVCGGLCTVYNGGAACLKAPGTQCLSATHNVGFCSSSGCQGSCNQFSTCGVRMDNNFCFTPSTQSILVGTS